ncbi:hypothetical protein PHLGIDRAFT_152213 [Phlebiopsis gigantea 11061_1 CR5-6]|uniref:Uncharacterized protein n=1 Tax=Phlebiopsis gigantea (strain 11061_1 CR5-6) TaxID=745531 RepID=A0A0C3S8K4_PHLG1|nr:hypothetical protein PHLGIDRAFT_152213 [Phlebiopsis gigantea 11061_1 CR5-6]
MHPLSAVDIFAEQLVSRGHGLPLWCPEPSPLGEVNVGDVGFIHRGSFFRLFNAICSPTDPSNHQGLPEDFIPLVLPKDEGIRYSDLPVGPICSLSTTWRESTSKDSVTPAYSFSCHCGRGAVVFLQEGARQEYAPSSQTIKTYVQKHHSSWHALAYKLGYSLHPEEIIFVSGCLKASRWAAAAYTQSTPPENTPQHFDYFPQTGFAVSHGSNSRLWMEQRSHTSLSPPSGVVGSCLFVKYYRLSGSRATTCGARTHIKPRGMPNIAILQALLLRARTATANVLGRCVMRCAGSAYMEGTPSANDYPDPLHHLSPYVLKYSSAKIAVVSHDDLYSILPHAEHLSDIPRYLREERVPIEIEGDTGTLA